jgi:catechol 2,3-dioxygenase-like lactoylglutathione lyase family enzyme
MFHSTAMVPDYDLAVDRLAALFGLRVLEYSEADHPAVGRRGGMTWIGDGSIELGQPIVEGAQPDRFVQRTGGGMSGVALWVEDLAATVDHLAAHGVGMPVQLAGFGFTSPRETFGLHLEWSDFTVEEDPRLGAALPPHRAPPLVEVTHQAFVGAIVDDPIDAARGLGDRLGVPVTFEAPDAGPGDPGAGLSLGDCTLALFRLAPEASQELWGRGHERPRVHLLGLAVDDLAGARDALGRAGIAVLRERDHLLVLDTRTTAGVEVALVDHLLPGDPRS